MIEHRLAADKVQPMLAQVLLAFRFIPSDYGLIVPTINKKRHVPTMLNSLTAWHPSPYLLLVLTTLFWSGNFVLGRAVHAVFTPFTLSFWRWAIALAILLPFVWASLREQGSLVRRHGPILLLLSILGVVNFNTFVYIGLQSTTATNAVIMLSVTPVLIVALSFLLLRQTVTGWQALGIGVSLAGVLVIVGQRRMWGHCWPASSTPAICGYWRR